MGRAIALLYGAVSYCIFLASFLYAIWFVWTLDQAQTGGPLNHALMVNTGLLLLFAAQHNIMARQGFKRVWTKLVPESVERSTFVLAASVILFLLCRYWEPIPRVIWEIEAQAGVLVLNGLFWLGWVIVLVSTFFIGHFDLFGLKQVWTNWQQKPYEHQVFHVPGPYKFVRHPLYFGFLVSFWSAPLMTLGHLYFAGVTTVWVLLSIQLEERDLVTIHGDSYKEYKGGVSMLVPWPSKRK